MKTVILMRHSRPQKGPGLPNEQIPLSGDGVLLARALFLLPVFREADRVCSSPYRRALDTARLLGRPVHTDPRLRERELGDPASLNGNFWGRQYREQDFKNPGGESLNEVRQRMSAFMVELLDSMADGETAAVVSHAAAICSYLLNFCSITVLDEEKKWRQIKFGTETVLNGPMATPGGFRLAFEGSSLVELSYFEH